jgi:Glycosyltransferase family 17
MQYRYLAALLGTFVSLTFLVYITHDNDFGWRKIDLAVGGTKTIVLNDLSGVVVTKSLKNVTSMAPHLITARSVVETTLQDETSWNEVPLSERMKNADYISNPIEPILAQENVQEFLLGGSLLQRLESLEAKLNRRIRETMSREQIIQTCKKYNMQPLPPSLANSMPRIFYGVAFNREIDVLLMSLYEMVDLIHSFVIVEANATFSGTPRAFQFPSMISRLKQYADRTPWNNSVYDKIVYHLWPQIGATEYIATEDTPMPGSLYYGREEAIRNSLRDVWIAMGMRNTDIFIISDTDEFVNRDFLLSLKVCDAFPMFREKSVATTATTGTTTAGPRTTRTVTAATTTAKKEGKKGGKGKNSGVISKKDLCRKNKILARSLSSIIFWTARSR